MQVSSVFLCAIIAYSLQQSHLIYKTPCCMHFLRNCKLLYGTHFIPILSTLQEHAHVHVQLFVCFSPFLSLLECSFIITVKILGMPREWCCYVHVLYVKHLADEVTFLTASFSPSSCFITDLLRPLGHILFSSITLFIIIIPVIMLWTSVLMVCVNSYYTYSCTFVYLPLMECC